MTGVRALWQIVGGPRKYEQGNDGADIDVGWAWDIEPIDGGERRVIRVEVAAGASPPADLTHAIQTEGKPLVTEHLTDEEPPERILVHWSGASEI